MLNTPRLFSALALVLALTPLASAQSARRGENPNRAPARTALVTPPVNFASGGATVYTSRAAFNADNPGLPTEDFEDAAPQEACMPFDGPLSATDPAPPYFSAGEILPGITFTTTELATSLDLWLYDPTACYTVDSYEIGNAINVDDFVMVLDPAVDAIGFDVASFSGVPVTIVALDGSGNVLASTTISGLAPTFRGFASTGPAIASVVARTAAAADYVEMDNVSFGNNEEGSVEITATVSSTTVEQGGSITFNYTVTNNTGNDVTGDLFFRAQLGTNTVAQGEIINNGTLQEDQAFSASFTQQVPQNAPPTTYTYSLNIGLFPNTVVDAETFQITVTPSRLGSSVATAWSVSDVTPWAEVSAAAPEASVVAMPNPFAGETTLRFTLEEAAQVRLAVYDLLGREVALLADGAMEAGQHEAAFEAGSLARGTYVYRLRVGDRVETGRLTLAE